MSISPVSSASARERVVDDRLVRDGVEVGVPPLAPVVRVPGGRHVAVGDPVLEDEGTGPDRVRRAAVGGVEHRRRSDVAGLRLGQVVGEGGPRRLQVDRDRQRPGDVRAAEIGEGGPGQHAARRGLDVLMQGGRVERRAVVEHDVRAQRDGEGGEVLVRRDRLGQVRLDAAGGVHDGQGVEDGAAVEEAPLVPTRRRGIEAALLGVDAEGQRPSRDRPFRGDPVPPGSVGLRRAGFATQGAEPRRPRRPVRARRP